jgi:hypothetical protein
VDAHPSPQSFPLQQGRGGTSPTIFRPTTNQYYRARASRIKFVLSWWAKNGQYEPASSSLGVSREFHLTLFPQAQPRPGLPSQK